MIYTIETLQQAYQTGEITPIQLFDQLFEAIAKDHDYNAWISLLNKEQIAAFIDALGPAPAPHQPLWGIPFAVKDNLDLKDLPTTAGCPEYQFMPKTHAHVVQKLIDAGAIPVGKTNMDQFATGLNGTRSPYGICKNAKYKELISGGSSSGSAVSVALGHVVFSLGTDTAGSGRVPAALNGLVGLKPTRGLLSNSGLVPACQSLDSISIFAHTVADAACVLAIAQGEDQSDPYSRPNPYHNHPRYQGLPKNVSDIKLGIIPEAQLAFFGDNDYQNAYQTALDNLRQQGFSLIEIDYQCFNEAALLLYEGPWVAERYVAIESMITSKPEAIEPTVRQIIQGGAELKASDAFKAQYRLESLKKRCYQQLERVDAMLTPTIGKAYRIDELLAEPIQANSNLGYYTNFMNLLDLSAIAIPAGKTEHEVPFGITLCSFAFHDQRLIALANQLNQDSSPDMVSADNKTIPVVVCGAHLEGMPLNWQLKDRGATLIKTCQTQPCYRLYLLNDPPPLLRPALVKQRHGEKGIAVEVEVWAVPTENFGSFVTEIPAPLGIGKVLLDDGSSISGFICDDYGLEGATDISKFGTWRRFIASRKEKSKKA